MRSWLRKITEKIPRSILGVAVGALILLLAVAGFENYHDLKVAREREEALQARIEERRRAVEELERRIERLGDDPALLEQLAREQLGMAWEEDLVLLLPADASSAPATRQATIDRPSGDEP
jgi:cell division protein FtsB